MKEITVRIRDDDYEWMLSRAQEILDKFAQAGSPLSFTPEELIQRALQDGSRRTIGEALYSGIEEAERMCEKAVNR